MQKLKFTLIRDLIPLIDAPDIPVARHPGALYLTKSLQQTIQQLLQQEFISQGHLCELDAEALAGDDVPDDGVRAYGSAGHLKS